MAEALAPHRALAPVPLTFVSGSPIHGERIGLPFLPSQSLSSARCRADASPLYSLRQTGVDPVQRTPA